MRCTIAYTQHCGLNPGQQDALWAGGQVFQQRNLLPRQHESDATSTLAAVADGVADSPMPQRASRFVLEALAARIDAGAPCDARLVRRVHALLCQALGRGRTRGASTTLALAAVQDEEERCTVLHAGDSRVWRIAADGRWQQLTRDHTVLQRMIDEGEARPGVEYATLYDMLDSCLVADEEETDFAIGCRMAPFARGDTLLLCTDGVHDVLEDRLMGLHDSQAAPLDQLKVWRSAILKSGAPDNFSMVLLRRTA